MRPTDRHPDLRAPHDASEIIGYAYRLYARNFRAMFLIGLTTAPLQMLGAVVQDRIGTPNGATAALPFEVAGALVTLIASGALIFAVNDVASGQAPDFGRSLDAAFARFGALLTTNLLSAVLTLLSVIGIPYFAVRWNFSPQAVIIEGKRNWAALDASSSIVKGRWWRTLGVLLLIVMVAFVPLIAIGAASLLPTLAATTIASAGLALVLPFIVSGQTLLYYDLRARTLLAATAGGVMPPLEQPEEAPRQAGADGGDPHRPDE
ncbi:MAG TPA: glycerophosphoryl diester phosphodiesterase membrane domain-containing protein [Dehalococcoidia bacterium]|nr:glycerophosphoryl diester phosphodiesterase membrane domain-containing protein [Dehalococcoidia bacterium]